MLQELFQKIRIKKVVQQPVEPIQPVETTSTPPAQPPALNKGDMIILLSLIETSLPVLLEVAQKKAAGLTERSIEIEREAERVWGEAREVFMTATEKKDAAMKEAKSLRVQAKAIEQASGKF